LNEEESAVTTFDRYPGPSHPDKITTDDVHQALAFLIAIEPHEEDDIDSDEDYEAALEAFRDEADAATLTLRRFAEQAQPNRLRKCRPPITGSRTILDTWRRLKCPLSSPAR
jgi:hypothetical protein